MKPSARHGTVLIIVASISALLAGLAITFLLRIRDGAQATEFVVQETQARLMLHAACAYILETSRIGYGIARHDAAKPANSELPGLVTLPAGGLAHREAFGWIDVRESDGLGFPEPGLPGPRDQTGRRLARVAGVWPDVGGVVMCSMHRWKRPPYAISPLVSANPFLAGAAERGDPRWGLPLLSDPDPYPAVANGWPGSIDESLWGMHVTGDSDLVMASANRSWFRVRRLSAATFLVTCGAGGTLGFKDWDEVLLSGAQRTPGAPGGPELFYHDRGQFELLRQSELRLWYEVRWSAAVRPLDFRFEEAMWWGTWLQNAFAYRTYPVNGSQYTGWGRANRFNPNHMGTLSYVQRLEARSGEPIDPVTGSPLPW